MDEGLEREDVRDLDSEEPVKAPTRSGDTGSWERALARFLTVNKVPVTWKTGKFAGISSYTLARIAPMRARLNPDESLSKLPLFFRLRQHERNLIVFVTNRKYGDDLEDSLVVMRLGTFMPMFATHINSDRERYIDAAQHHG